MTMVYRAGMDTRDTTERTAAAQPSVSRGWTFLTNHAHVLLCLRERGPTMRERPTHRASPNASSRPPPPTWSRRLSTSQGRRPVRRTIRDDGRLRHPLETHHTIDDLITALR